MKSDQFRRHHQLTILKGFERQRLPLDLFIMDYCRAHKALGAKDRKAIVDAIYGITRWRGLLDHLIGAHPTWEARSDLYADFDPAAYANQTNIPLNVRCSFPNKLFDLFAADYGEEEAFRLCLVSNTTAPTTIRVNGLKISRDELIQQWKEQYKFTPCEQAPYGITFNQNINFRALDEFRHGYFEVQDEGSQLVAGLVNPKPGDIVLDFCAGSGGKTLALAVPMIGKGQIYLHDIRQEALAEARRRLRRAGIQNAQVIQDKSPHLSKLKKKCDWVLVDAPCSGTGTLRRNPDMKWRFEIEWISRLQGQQRTIFERALSFLKPGGRIVYATCSVLRAENEVQSEHFAKTYGLQIEGQPFKSLPTQGGMDGFFGVTFA
ncbi:MAG: RsmB/NOP family class I SAM-dependent RNA methyltransferase [Nitrosomonas sp.]|nr:MAG: RsmB/NOP family class I SAM-dependent RNA methyltransferase [Nitrosomonas sp.]